MAQCTPLCEAYMQAEERASFAQRMVGAGRERKCGHAHAGVWSLVVSERSARGSAHNSPIKFIPFVFCAPCTFE